MHLDHRRALRWGGATAALAAPVVVGVTWAAARTLTATPAPRVRQPTMTARFLDDRHVAVTGDRANDVGAWGLAFDGGFVRMDAPVLLDDRVWTVDGAVVHPYRVLDGHVPTSQRQRDRRHGGRRAGSRREVERPEASRDRRRRRRDRRLADMPRPWPVAAIVTPYAWPDDPQVLARHANARFRIDGIRSGGHTLPTWVLTPPQPNDTWVVGVHGRGSSRTELFRIADVALRSGHPVLIASYRTDAWTDAPASTTTLGTVEWRDVEANVAVALAKGAKQVVLAGCSLGGGLVAQVVRRSELSPWISGVILDSPALSWNRVLRHVAAARRLPTVLVPAVMTAARARARIDWSALDHLSAVDEFSQPVLLLHGEEDDVVPIWSSEAFALARPELVTFERFPDADHVTSWNHAPLRYSRALRRFLARIDSPAG